MSNKGRRLKLGVLLSGSGRTLQNLIDSRVRGELEVDFGIVISSRPDVYGLARAQAAGFSNRVVDRKLLTVSDFDKAISEALRMARVDLVCMAGFLSLWNVPPDFSGRVLNIHPALLPKFGGKGFYGERIHTAVLSAGETESGCTVHFADNEYDHGPILLQRRVPVLPTDTPSSLAARVFEAEKLAYPQAIRQFAEKHDDFLGA